jgi:hypothetical protein
MFLITALVQTQALVILANCLKFEFTELFKAHIVFVPPLLKVCVTG